MRRSPADGSMSQSEPFRHQIYQPGRPAAPYHLVTPGAHPPVGSEEFDRRMDAVGRALSESGVSAVYLAHGTFVGGDTLGIFAGLGRVFPSIGALAPRLVKRLVDRLTGELGNYTGEFAQCFETAINRPDRPHIPVRRFPWSGENHHLGRADGAVRLIEELAARREEHGGRILLWGHSHAGNIFALASHLLSGDRRAIDAFFEAAEIYYTWPVFNCVDIPVWARMRQLLVSNPAPLGSSVLDMVTFGTPIRYGWNAAGHGKLLHFVNRRPAERLPEYRAVFPPRLDDVMMAADGDYVQQLGIAGTNFPPSVLAWRSRLADRRLHALFERGLPAAKQRERFAAGAIVPDAGTTLLVDYGPLDGGLARHMAGHALYTSRQWLLFHAEQTVRHFYTPETDQAG